MIETILKELEKNSKGFNFLLEKFDISEDELMKTINDLIHDKKIFLNSNNKYEIVSDNFIIAELRKGLNGRGLITNNNMTITIESYDTHNALFGDIVIVKPYSLNKGTVLGIVKRRTNKIVCEVCIKQDKLILNPVIKDTEFSISIPKKFFNALNLIVGDRVCIDLDNKVSDDNTIYINDIAKINKMGHYTDRYSDEVAIAINRGFNIDFSEEAMYEASMIPKEVTGEDRKLRLDLRDLPIISIDPVNAKDLDDGFTIKKLENGNFLLVSCIMDVSHYIKPGMHLFQEVLERSTSVYIGEVVIPMLPSVLSNGILSLNEGVDRLVKAYSMEVSPNGEVVNYQMDYAVINSKKRMNYNDVNTYYDTGCISYDYLPFKDILDTALEFSKIMDLKKFNNGSLVFDSSDMIIEKDSNGTITSIYKRDEGLSERIIENIALLTGECQARKAFCEDWTFIYRIDDMPNNIKLDKSLSIIKDIDSDAFKNKEFYGVKIMQSILNKYRGTNEFPAISNMLLRCLSIAKYSTQNTGHYALATPYYAQVTSPIRRLPDLINQLLIDMYYGWYIPTEEDLKMLCNLEDYTCEFNYKERQADACEKDYIDLCSVKMMANYIGVEFRGVIIDIDRKGALIKLDNGIIVNTNPVTLGNYNTNPIKKTMIINDTGYKMKLATSVLVRISSVDISNKKIYVDITKVIVKEKEQVSKKVRKI